MRTPDVRKAAAVGLPGSVLWATWGCSAPSAPAPPAPAAAPAVSTIATVSPRSEDTGSGRDGSGGGGHHRGGSEGGVAAAVAPADFPPDVPLPPGELHTTSGADGRWSALLLVSGSAADAARSAMRFYVANGFTADSASTAHRDRNEVTIVTENRDHSPTSTNLVVGVAAR